MSSKELPVAVGGWLAEASGSELLAHGFVSRATSHEINESVSIKNYK